MYNPRLQVDSLIGYYDRANRDRLAIPVRNVQSVEFQQLHKLRTTGFVVASVVAVYFVVMSLIWGSPF
ncbi:MAG: hypothetical protein H7Z74_08735 [Anaerolineae bacterium]|nr:hypothetical protein [Gemmatimonadaceae bacterium]